MGVLELGRRILLNFQWGTPVRPLIIVAGPKRPTEPPPAVAGTRQVPPKVSVGVKTMLCMGAISARTAASAAAA